MEIVIVLGWPKFVWAFPYILLGETLLTYDIEKIGVMHCFFTIPQKNTVRAEPLLSPTDTYPCKYYKPHYAGESLDPRVL